MIRESKMSKKKIEEFLKHKEKLDESMKSGEDLYYLDFNVLKVCTKKYINNFLYNVWSISLMSWKYVETQRWKWKTEVWSFVFSQWRWQALQLREKQIQRYPAMSVCLFIDLSNFWITYIRSKNCCFVVDYNRVKLKETSESDNDYINASFVKVRYL